MNKLVCFFLFISTFTIAQNNIKIDGFFDDNNLVNLKKYRDPRGRTTVKYGVTALPTTVVINPTGLEIGRIIGDIDWDTADVRSFFKKLLENK